MGITYQRDVSKKKHYESLATLLNTEWKFFDHTASIMKSRFQSGQLFVVAYDGKTPIGLIETITLPKREQSFKKYNTNPEWVGLADERMLLLNYNSLTSQGLWRKKEPQETTLVCVDVTLSNEYRGNGVAQTILTTLLGYVAKREPSISHILTYTPEHHAIINWHQRNGAQIHTIIPYARHGYRTPHVAVMDYSKLLATFRKNIQRHPC